MPDIAVVLCNRAVTGEEASLGDIDQALAAPTQRVAGIIRQSLALAHHISVEIGQGLEPVLGFQFMLQTGQIFFLAGGQHFGAGQKVDGTGWYSSNVENLIH